MEKGLVSVITPTYNCVDFIGETIESVQSQSYQHWEMIIVDDCSTDNTKELVIYKKTVESNIFVWRTILELLLLELRQWN